MDQMGYVSIFIMGIDICIKINSRETYLGENGNKFKSLVITLKSFDDSTWNCVNLKKRNGTGSKLIWIKIHWCQKAF